MSTLNNRPSDYEFAASILIVDDEQLALDLNTELCTEVFKDLGAAFKVKTALTLAQAFELLSKEIFHVVLLDKDLGKDANGKPVDGIKAIPTIRLIQPNIEILVLTGHENVPAAVEATQLGASDYLLKKGDEKYIAFRNEKIKNSILKAQIRAARERESAQAGSNSLYVCKSPKMRRVNDELKALAETNAPIPVTITGASGVGKTEAAKQLNRYRAHFLGQSNRPFFNINFARMDPDLAENELFGHDPNAYTGSKTTTYKPGYFELANNGDLFLDEIGDAAPKLQIMLLKVLDEKEFQRMGGTQSIPTTARVIFATNKNLEELVNQGKFRPDLYYRITTLQIDIPPLEERKEDIPDLIRVLLTGVMKHVDVDIHYEDLPGDLIEYFLRDNIPGNIREIQSDLYRLALHAFKLKNKNKALLSWKSILKPSTKAIFSQFIKDGHLTLADFLKCKTQFLDKGPINIKELKNVLENKLIEEACERFPTLTERSRALSQHPSNLLKKMNSESTSAHLKAISGGRHDIFN